MKVTPFVENLGTLCLYRNYRLGRKEFVYKYERQVAFEHVGRNLPFEILQILINYLTGCK
jgi:hypothetical protein